MNSTIAAKVLLILVFGRGDTTTTMVQQSSSLYECEKARVVSQELFKQTQTQMGNTFFVGVCVGENGKATKTLEN